MNKNTNNKIQVQDIKLNQTIIQNSIQYKITSLSTPKPFIKLGHRKISILAINSFGNKIDLVYPANFLLNLDDMGNILILNYDNIFKIDANL